MKLRDLLVVLLAVAAGAAGMWWVNRPAQKSPKADVSGLRAQLDAAAERGLPVPSLEPPNLPTPNPATPQEK